MQKVILKKEVSFRTNSGTITADTLILDNDIVAAGDTMHIVAVVSHSKIFTRYVSKCIFRKNSIVRIEPFSEENLAKAQFTDEL